MSRWPLPKTWQWAKAGDIAAIVGGGTPSTKNPANFAENGIPWITPADLSDYQEEYISRGKRDLSPLGLSSCGAQLIPKDSVLFTSRAPVGYCVLAANEICTNQGFKSLVLMGGIDPKYIRYYLLSSKEYAESLASGSTFKELSGKRMTGLEIPVPPRNEQKRIASKVEELQAHSRRAREALEKTPDLLEQVRQSILATALRGDLTQKWREKHKGKIEPAKELLKRIRIERRRRWESAELQKLKGKGLIGDELAAEFSKCRKQYKEPVPLDTSNLPELPGEWCWIQAEQLVPLDTPILYGILQPGPNIPNGIPYVRPTEIVDNRIDLQNIRRTSVEIAARYKRSKLRFNDILLSIVGTIGKVAKVPKELEGGNITQSSVRIRADRFLILPDYLEWALRSPILLEQYEEKRLGTAVPRLNVEDVRRLTLPLAPIEEQEQIIHAIIERYNCILASYGYVMECLKQIPCFEESILQRAFHGALVPQDPNDEPASVLLERIRQEKARKAVEQKNVGKRKGKKMKHTKVEKKDILTILQESARPMTPEEVFIAGGFDEESVDTFYEELRAAVAGNQVHERRKGNEARLEAIK